MPQGWEVYVTINPQHKGGCEVTIPRDRDILRTDAVQSMGWLDVRRLYVEK
jgi:hypothetical protein